MSNVENIGKIELTRRQFVKHSFIAVTAALGVPLDSYTGNITPNSQTEKHLDILDEEHGLSPEQQEFTNPFVLRTEIINAEGSPFAKRQDSDIGELNEEELGWISKQMQFLSILAEQASLARDISEYYSLNNPEFNNNLCLIKEGSNLIMASVLTFEEENGRRGIVYKDFVDQIAMPFYIEDGENFGITRLSDGRIIPYYKDRWYGDSYTLQVLEENQVALMLIPEDIPTNEPQTIKVPQAVTPIHGNVNVRERSSTESPVKGILISPMEAIVVGSVIMPGTGKWYAVISTDGQTTGFVSAEVTRPQSLISTGDRRVQSVAEDQLVGRSVEVADGNFDWRNAIQENAQFSTENRMASSDGAYVVNFSQGYLKNVAQTNNIFFDQRIFDEAVKSSINKTFNLLNADLRSLGRAEKTKDDIITLKPFVQRGGREIGEGEIQGSINKGIVHYLCTNDEMVAIREQFREKLGNEDFIEISFLYGSNSMSLGFMFFNEMGQLVIVTKRLHYKEDAPYESRNRIADTLSAALWVGVNDAVLYGEIGSKGLNRPLNYDFVYNMFGY